MLSPVQQQASAPPEIRNLALWLRNQSGFHIRTGVLNERRVAYFKGRAAVKALLSPGYAKLKNVPPVPDEQAAVQLLTQTIPFAFYLRVDRGDHLPPPPSQLGQSQSQASPKDQPRILRIAQAQQFSQDDYFVFLIEGSQLKVVLGGIGMVAVVLAGCMFPLWPSKLRVGVWYLSIAVLGLIAAFFALAVVRLIVWVITKLTVKPGIWIFPKLFEDVGFFDSFVPLWAWDLPPVKKKKRSKAEKAASADQSGAGVRKPAKEQLSEDAGHFEKTVIKE